MTIATLALRFDAPMQSWGQRSQFIDRDTGTEPTKSGVVGVLGAACGVDRTDDLRVQELGQLTMGVRVDREGLLESDFHTTQNVPNTAGVNKRTVVSRRSYLADALFLVLLEGDSETLTRLEQAVRSPHWPLCFGRKAFVPATPLVDPPGAVPAGGKVTGLFHRPLHEVVCELPWLEPRPEERQAVITEGEGLRLRAVVDVAPDAVDAEPRLDSPLSFHPDNRRFTTRTVRVTYVSPPPPSQS
ncbi:type I-E CRISPR-associated protein Cas5/CasD [Lipingzhangella sp. LS1_29]|uniref:Type I-E CRISPR-associated protein Cas5/CasD n=1 Tax=Lipingzhangella rawalii TaxID=2055835 RepID=A0ABU2H5E8_9ACTN|nr:type I-E CRISPR-associated protein Cas5/CasD [Lipingzhangella rawalii]MDS1270532.1 type I-E CRISPR-associated protein Cas5/CasD [Lipingzhangella rawalii]